MTPQPHLSGRIARPDDLHLLMTVVNAKDWILLLSVAVLFGMAGIWSVSGTMRMTVSGYGVLVQESPGSDLACIFYISAQDGEALRPGMAAQITPDVANRARHGSVAGTVTSVSRAVAFPKQERVKVTVQLQPESAKPGHLKPGTTAFARVTIQQRAPITYLLPWIER